MQSFHANLRCSPCSIFDDLTGHRRQTRSERAARANGSYILPPPFINLTDQHVYCVAIAVLTPPRVLLLRVLVEDVVPEVRRANRALRCDDPHSQSRLTGKQTNIKGSVFCVLQGTAGNDGPPGPPGERVSQRFNRFHTPHPHPPQLYSLAFQFLSFGHCVKNVKPRPKWRNHNVSVSI